MKHYFIVPGKPVPQERPCVTRRGTFDRQRSKDAKAYVYALGLQARQIAGAEVSEKSFQVTLNFCNPHASSDIDNLCKLVLDGLNGVFWKDDRQVVHLTAYKVKEPLYTRTQVWIEELAC